MMGKLLDIAPIRQGWSAQWNWVGVEWMHLFCLELLEAEILDGEFQCGLQPGFRK